MIDQIFGIPLYKSSINSNSYDKESILNTVLKNYEKSNERNSWDNESYIKSKIHHSLCDETNQTFEKPDFSSLKSVYESEIKKYLRMMNYQIHQNLEIRHHHHLQMQHVQTAHNLLFSFHQKVCGKLH